MKQKQFTDEQVVAILQEATKGGKPIIALALRGLCHSRGIDLAYIEPCKPRQHGFAESFISRLRDELLARSALFESDARFIPASFVNTNF